MVKLKVHVQGKYGTPCQKAGNKNDKICFLGQAAAAVCPIKLKAQRSMENKMPAKSMCTHGRWDKYII